MNRGDSVFLLRLFGISTISRFNPHHVVEDIYRAAEEWRDRCLIGDSALLTNEPAVWTVTVPA